MDRSQLHENLKVSNDHAVRQVCGIACGAVVLVANQGSLLRYTVAFYHRLLQGGPDMQSPPLTRAPFNLLCYGDSQGFVVRKGTR